MKRVARSLIALYPANWRERYGDEFETLLEDSALGAAGMFDLLKGAVKMQLKVPAFPKLAVLFSIAGLLVGLGVSFVVPSRYLSEAEVVFDRPNVTARDGTNLREHFMQLENQILSRTSLSTIIQDPRLDLYKSDRATRPLEDVIEKMRKEDLVIRPVAPPGMNREAQAFSIAFTYRDRMKAQQTVQALLTKFQDANLVSQRIPTYVKRGLTYDQVDRMEQRLAAIEKRLGMYTPPPSAVDLPAVPPDGINLDVLDPPSLAVSPIYPNRSVFMLTGFGAGFVAALIVAIFRRKLPPIPFPAQTA